MKLKITKQIPEWSAVNKDKECVIVEFPNCDFKWMPSYKDLVRIMVAVVEMEEESWKKT